jgi:hypothetical protein
MALKVLNRSVIAVGVQDQVEEFVLFLRVELAVE